MKWLTWVLLLVGVARGAFLATKQDYEGVTDKTLHPWLRAAYIVLLALHVLAAAWVWRLP